MDASDRRRAMRVAATHAAKMAIELNGSVYTMAEQIGGSAARWDTEASFARSSIAAVRRELDDLEALIAGKKPKIEAAPRGVA